MFIFGWKVFYCIYIYLYLFYNFYFYSLLSLYLSSSLSTTFFFNYFDILLFAIYFEFSLILGLKLIFSLYLSCISLKCYNFLWIISAILSCIGNKLCFYLFNTFIYSLFLSFYNYFIIYYYLLFFMFYLFSYSSSRSFAFSYNLQNTSFY